jgi:hypothetical protein
MRPSKHFGGYDDLNYDKACTILGKRDTRKLCNNTYLEACEGYIAVRHWSTRILRFFPDGSTVFSLNGYWTNTTKARVRNFTNAAYIFTRKGVECIGSSYNEPYKYFDGVRVSANGTIDSIPLILDLLINLFPNDIKTMDQAISFIANMDWKNTLKLWRKGDLYRSFVSKYCNPQHLPGLMMVKYGEHFMNTIQERLSHGHK